MAPLHDNQHAKECKWRHILTCQLLFTSYADILQFEFVDQCTSLLHCVFESKYIQCIQKKANGYSISHTCTVVPIFYKSLFYMF